MNLTQARKDFWIHLNPAGSDNFMVHGRTYSEPRFDKQLGHYVVTDEGRMSNDRLTCVNVIAKTFLPEALWKSVTPGKKAHVYNYTFWELKDEKDELSLPIAQKTDYQPETYFEMQQFTDHLVFGLIGKAELHERYSTFNTRQDDPDNPLKVQYVNKYGQVITHGNPNVMDSYIMIGNPGDVVSPYDIAKLWGSDPQTIRKLDTMLIDAYLKGIRFITPPEEDVIKMNVSILNEDLIKVTSNSRYYGFPENMVFSERKKFKSDCCLGIRSLERCLIEAVIAYRWFFGKSNLKVSFSLVHNKKLEEESSWEDEKDYCKYMKHVMKYDAKGMAAFSRTVNDRINAKCEKYKDSHCFVPSDYLEKDFFEKVVENAE